MLEQDIRYQQSKPERVSLTLGVVSGQGNDINSIEEVVRVADEALYRGKNAGRNRVETAVLSSNQDIELTGQASSPHAGLDEPEGICTFGRAGASCPFLDENQCGQNPPTGNLDNG